LTKNVGFFATASDRRLLLLEFGVGFNTPVIIRFPFEQMAAQFPDTTLVRFNRDYPQLSTQGISRYVAFTEGNCVPLQPKGYNRL